MFGLSGEHLLILAGVLLIFGPRKLPELGASVGKALRNFKEGLNSPPSSGKVEVLKDESAAPKDATSENPSDALKTTKPTGDKS
ncbi:MAG: twin-arginine translocase TatA/TatE family subunit [Bdellovibrionota bacterium]